MHREDELEAEARRASEALRQDLIEINRCGYEQVARIVEIMRDGAWRGGDDPRVRSGICRLEKLFGRPQAPDRLGAALAEMQALRSRIDDASSSDSDVDRMSVRLAELDEIVGTSRAASPATFVPAMREAARQWREFHERAGELGHDVMNALFSAVDALPMVPASKSPKAAS